VTAIAYKIDPAGQSDATLAANISALVPPNRIFLGGLGGNRTILLNPDTTVSSEGGGVAGKGTVWVVISAEDPGGKKGTAT